MTVKSFGNIAISSLLDQLKATKGFEKDAHNLGILAKHQFDIDYDGEGFADSTKHYKVFDGRLTQLSKTEETARKTAYKIPSSPWKKSEADVKALVSDLVGRIKVKTRAEAEASGDFIISDVTDGEKQINEFVLDKLSEFKHKIWDRKSLDKSYATYLEEKVWNNAKSEGIVPEFHTVGSTKASELTKFQAAWKRALLGTRLAVDYIGGGGWSGSYILKSYDGELLGIFKPGDEDSWGPKAPKAFSRWRRKKYLNKKNDPHAREFIEKCGGSGHLAEEASYIVDQVLGWNTVPTTKVIEYTIDGEKKTGSFQLFDKGLIDGTDALGIKKNYKAKRKYGVGLKVKGEISVEEFRKQFELLVIIDVLTGNMDRHAKNFLIKIASGEIVIIDGGMAFPTFHPDPKSGISDEMLSKLYFWAKDFVLAKKPFTDDGIKRINEAWDKRDQLRQKVFDFYVKNELGESEEEKIKTAGSRAEMMIQRLTMLHHLYVTERSEWRPISALASYRTAAKVKMVLEGAKYRSPTSAMGTIGRNQTGSLRKKTPAIQSHRELPCEQKVIAKVNDLRLDRSYSIALSEKFDPKAMNEIYRIVGSSLYDPENGI